MLFRSTPFTLLSLTRAIRDLSPRPPPLASLRARTSTLLPLQRRAAETPSAAHSALHSADTTLLDETRAADRPRDRPPPLVARPGMLCVRGM